MTTNASLIAACGLAVLSTVQRHGPCSLKLIEEQVAPPTDPETNLPLTTVGEVLKTLHNERKVEWDGKSGNWATSAEGRVVLQPAAPNAATAEEARLALVAAAADAHAHDPDMVASIVLQGGFSPGPLEGLPAHARATVGELVTNKPFLFVTRLKPIQGEGEGQGEADAAEGATQPVETKPVEGAGAPATGRPPPRRR